MVSVPRPIEKYVKELGLDLKSSISISYDSSNDDIRWRDEDNGADRMALDKTSGDLEIEGEITESSAL